MKFKHAKTCFQLIILAGLLIGLLVPNDTNCASFGIGVMMVIIASPLIKGLSVGRSTRN